MVVNYGVNRVRFPAPVPSGGRIRGRFRVLAVEDGAAAGSARRSRRRRVRGRREARLRRRARRPHSVLTTLTWPDRTCLLPWRAGGTVVEHAFASLCADRACVALVAGVVGGDCERARVRRRVTRAATRSRSSSAREGRSDASYSITFKASGGCGPALPYQYRVTNGALPPGLSLSSSGVLSGRPTQSGSWNFWVQLSDENPPSQSWCDPAQGRPRVPDPGAAGHQHRQPADDDVGTTNQAYSNQLTARCSSRTRTRERAPP